MKLIEREYGIDVELRGRNRFQFEIASDPESNNYSGSQVERQEKGKGATGPRAAICQGRELERDLIKSGCLDDRGNLQVGVKGSTGSC
jgi:hypothetical protein